MSVDDVLALHRIAIADQGGDPTLRDSGLLESAVMMPQQQFSGNFLHDSIPAMAAAYAFHICGNHPFVDGNKRAGVAAMIAFLSDNGWKFVASADEAEPVILNLAAGKMTKPEFTEWVRQHTREKPRMELREFFSKIESEQFNRAFQSLLPGETGAKTSEFAARSREVIRVMPFMSDIARQQQEAKSAGDSHGWERITMLAVGMMALYAIAEEVGYEW